MQRPACTPSLELTVAFESAPYASLTAMYESDQQRLAAWLAQHPRWVAAIEELIGVTLDLDTPWPDLRAFEQRHRVVRG